MDHIDIQKAIDGLQAQVQRIEDREASRNRMVITLVVTVVLAMAGGSFAFFSQHGEQKATIESLRADQRVNASGIRDLQVRLREDIAEMHRDLVRQVDQVASRVSGETQQGMVEVKSDLATLHAELDVLTREHYKHVSEAERWKERVRQLEACEKRRGSVLPIAPEDAEW